MSPPSRHFAIVCVSCLFAPIAVVDAHSRQARSDYANDCPHTVPGLSVQLDNDLFAGTERDADYTGGVALRWTPEDPGVDVASDRFHANVDRLLGVFDESMCRRHAWQLGLFSVTPVTMDGVARSFNDRPFASALMIGTTAVWSRASERSAFQSTLEFGALGLDLARSVHSVVHQLVGSEKPQGYQHQISDGGEFTARYALTQYRLVHDGAAGGETLQIKDVASLSAGYLTEGSVGWSMRWGRINTPWQAFASEFADYLPAPAPLFESASGELYAFAGARIKLRGYNALAQGQFRDSDHVLRGSELEHVLGEAWFGVHWQSAGNLSITYTVRVQTPELREEPARRTPIWAGIGVSWSM